MQVFVTAAWDALDRKVGTQHGVVVPQADLDRRSTKTAGEDAICHIMSSVLCSKLPKKWAGAEWWVQVASQLMQLWLVM